jgi:hypothetical protein
VYIENDIRPTKVGQFTFRALRPPGSSTPVDASVSGGSLVTFRVYWGAQLDAGTVTVFFGDQSASVEDVQNFGGQGLVTSFESAVHYTNIAVTTPLLNQEPGIIEVAISNGFLTKRSSLRFLRHRPFAKCFRTERH